MLAQYCFDALAQAGPNVAMPWVMAIYKQYWAKIGAIRAVLKGGFSGKVSAIALHKCNLPCHISRFPIYVATTLYSYTLFRQTCCSFL